MTGGGVGFVNVGLMGETVYRLILEDLKREGLSTNATLVESRMRARWQVWSGQRYPYVVFSGFFFFYDTTSQIRKRDGLGKLFFRKHRKAWAH